MWNTRSARMLANTRGLTLTDNTIHSQSKRAGLGFVGSRILSWSRPSTGVTHSTNCLSTVDRGTVGASCGGRGWVSKNPLAGLPCWASNLFSKRDRLRFSTIVPATSPHST